MNASKDWDDIRETRTEHKPLIVSNLNEWDDEQIDIRSDPNEPRRAVLCDGYAGGCGKGFSIGLKAYNSGREHVCDDCRKKHEMRKLLKDQLKVARRFGHSEQACEVCRLEYEIDRLADRPRYDAERIYEQVLRPLARGGTLGRRLYDD